MLTALTRSVVIEELSPADQKS